MYSVKRSTYFARDVYEMMKYTSIDKNFSDSLIRSKYRSWVLRYDEKKKSNRPKYLETIKSKKNNKIIISTAHRKLLNKLYKEINIKKFPNEDNFSQIKLQKYETSR